MTLGLPISGILFHDEIPVRKLQEQAARYVDASSTMRSFKSSSRTRSFWAGRAVAALLLQTSKLQAVVVPNRRYGYLELWDSKLSRRLENRYINLSHTEGAAVAVMGPSPIGIDVERVSRSAERVFERISSQGEARQREKTPFLSIQNHQVPYALCLWTAKEAFSKALGVGLGFRFRDFEIDLSGPSYSATTTLKAPQHVDHPGILYRIYQDYLITIAVSRELLQGDFFIHAW